MGSFIRIFDDPNSFFFPDTDPDPIFLKGTVVQNCANQFESLSIKCDSYNSTDDARARVSPFKSCFQSSLNQVYKHALDSSVSFKIVRIFLYVLLFVQEVLTLLELLYKMGLFIDTQL